MRSLSRPDKGSLFFLFYSNAGRNKIMNVGSCGPWLSVRIRWGKSSSSHNSPSPYVLDCKRVRIFAYSSTREQSNKCSRAPHTPYRRVRLAREATLNYFEKKQLFCSLHCKQRLITNICLSPGTYGAVSFTIITEFFQWDLKSITDPHQHVK